MKLSSIFGGLTAIFAIGCAIAVTGMILKGSDFSASGQRTRTVNVSGLTVNVDVDVNINSNQHQKELAGKFELAAIISGSIAAFFALITIFTCIIERRKRPNQPIPAQENQLPPPELEIKSFSFGFDRSSLPGMP